MVLKCEIASLSEAALVMYEQDQMARPGDRHDGFLQNVWPAPFASRILRCSKLDFVRLGGEA
jgi:hypothetical protein